MNDISIFFQVSSLSLSFQQLIRIKRDAIHLRITMDRNIPDVWNIFSLSGPNYGQNRHPVNRNHLLMNDGFHVNWASYDQGMLQKWCDR